MIGGAFVKLTNLMAAQFFPELQYRSTILPFVTSPKERGTQLHGVFSLKSRKSFVLHKGDKLRHQQPSPHPPKKICLLILEPSDVRQMLLFICGLNT
jgi:hypothetical protein